MVDSNDKTRLRKREQNRQRQIQIEREQGLLRIDEVLKIVPFGPDVWRAGANKKSGRFPEGIKGTSNAHLWKKSEIDILKAHGLLHGWGGPESKWEDIKRKMAGTQKEASENENQDERPFITPADTYDCNHEDQTDRFSCTSLCLDREITSMKYRYDFPYDFPMDHLMDSSIEKYILR